MKLITAFLLTTLSAAGSAYAQDMSLLQEASVHTDTTTPTDGYYRHNIYKDAKPIPYPAVNTNNVKFFKRVWRDIDINDEKNALLNPPGLTLIEIIIDGLNTGKLTAFNAATTKKNPTGDAFTEALTLGQAMQKLTDSVLVPIFDNEGNQVNAEMRLNDFNPSSVTRFRIKEDIFYDKQRSRIETRIVGVAPLIKIEAGGEQVSEQPAFWLYFPEARNVFVTKESGIPELTFDDVFVQHKFNSVVVRESNTTEKVESPEAIEREIATYKERTWRY